MKIIKILWTGCPNCKRLEHNVNLALEKAWIQAIVEKVTDIEWIMFYDIVSLPWIVINEKVVSSWKVLEVDEIIELLDNSCCWKCSEDEDDECCSDNSCSDREIPKKTNKGCCCGGGNC